MYPAADQPPMPRASEIYIDDNGTALCHEHRNTPPYATVEVAPLHPDTVARLTRTLRRAIRCDICGRPLA